MRCDLQSSEGARDFLRQISYQGAGHMLELRDELSINGLVINGVLETSE